MEKLNLLVLFMLLAIQQSSCSNCYDHQNAKYATQFSVTACEQSCTVTPFFSPDHSIDTYLDLIQSAKESIDLYTPGFNSWSKCTNFSVKCNTCMGCSIDQQKQEEFPIFAALLNAVHQGVTVRIITNNFTQTSCKGMIMPLDWLFMNGVQIVYYTTTTFMHSKVVIIDHGKRTSISSVNFSFTSFMKNREAGVVLDDCSCPLIDLYGQVFQYDWENGDDYRFVGSYSASEKAEITDSSPMKIPPLKPYSIPGAYATKKITYKGVYVRKGHTSPDGARDNLLSTLSDTKSSLQVAIYQITDQPICSKLVDLHNSGINVTILVSDRIVSYADYWQAQNCYSHLYSSGMENNIKKSYSKFSFSHQKYWIVDEKAVHLSTGNWSPSDFPSGTTFAPNKTSKQSVNRDMLVCMEGTDIVDAFMEVFTQDWNVGTPWKPKK